ncbi:hypothetical isxcc1 transposase orfb (fragment) protein [Xanthomonas albilineans GPE PC73]|uniref:Hypothetical isxcc1 transposase orfb protein n=1 Tax=Xanthomonas albilineans (strain GPE PC73 / CFBP 7063) TaxID=380358 RepID=D2UF58_XANAP
MSSTTALAEWAERKSIALDFIEPARPMQNGFIERFNGSYRRGVLDMHIFRTLSEVREQTEFVLFMAPSSQELEPPEIQGRFSSACGRHSCHCVSAVPI